MSLYVETAPRQCVRRPLLSVFLVAAAIGGAVGLAGCSALRREPVVVAAPAPAVAAHTPPVVIAPPTPPREPIDAATPTDLASRHALAMHEQLRGLPLNELAQEIARLSALPPAPDTSVSLAMALLLTRNGGELNRAVGLVEPLARGTTADSAAWQPIARLLLARLLELRRLEDLLDRRNQELRDGQREVKQLNEKLEALKAIERSLAPRPISSAAPGRSQALVPQRPARSAIP